MNNVTKVDFKETSQAKEHLPKLQHILKTLETTATELSQYQHYALVTKLLNEINEVHFSLKTAAEHYQKQISSNKRD